MLRRIAMDRFTLLMLIVLIMIFILRFRHAYRKSKRNMNKGDQIQRKLEELRKKRDEE